jgi:hypothetical protein
MALGMFLFVKMRPSKLFKENVRAKNVTSKFDLPRQVYLLCAMGQFMRS